MKDRILTRMGDGARVMISAPELKEDLRSGVQDAAERGKIPELTSEEIERLFDIFCDPNKAVSVSPGEEVVVTDDGSTLTFNSGLGLSLGRVQSAQIYERACAADTASLGHPDYSFKPVKPIIAYEMQEYHTASMVTTIPLFYGSQPNLGLYFQPDGPYPNAAELLPMGKVEAARETQEKAAEHLWRDLKFISDSLYGVGCEGINFDTSASAGDADFYATLKAVEEVKKATPNMSVEVGMSSEFVLGMHGELQYQGQRLAGMYPHEQVKVVEAAGADIFGPAINVNTSESTPWNVARTVTFAKATVKAATIPVHVNVGMGVGGIPMYEIPSVDCVTRAAKALVQIGKVDGL